MGKLLSLFCVIIIPSFVFSQNSYDDFCIEFENTTKGLKIIETDSIISPFQHNIGIQINPYIRGSYTRGNYPWVFALRCGKFVKSWDLLGFDSRFSNANLEYVRYSNWDIGLFNRVFIPSRIISPFFETKLFYYHYSGELWNGYYLTPIVESAISYYIAPGFSIIFLKKRFQFDALFKTNYKNLRNGGLSLGVFEFSYRISYNFGRK